MAYALSNLFAITVTAPVVGLPSWLSGRGVLQWGDVPNTSLQTFDATVPLPSGGYYGPRESKLTAWCGGALKRTGSVYMLGAAGGHNDYAGNEVQTLNLNANAPAWAQPRGASAWADILNTAPAYLDGRRSATHTYYSTQFDNVSNKFVVMPAPGMGAPGRWPEPPSGFAYNDQYMPTTFNVATGDWDAFLSNTTWPQANGDFTAAGCCSNPLTGEIYYARLASSGRMWKYIPSTKVWTQLGQAYHNNYAGLALDHTRGRMLSCGDFGGTLPPRIYSTAGVQVSVTFGGLGGSVLQSGGYPGIVYDEVRDSFWVFFNTNPVTIYEVTAGGLVVSQPSMTGTMPASRVNGIHTSVQYVPELKGVMFHNSYSGNVKFMRTA